MSNNEAVIILLPNHIEKIIEAVKTTSGTQNLNICHGVNLNNL